MSLRMTLEISPGGDKERTTQVLELHVWNDESGDLIRGNYQFRAVLADGTERRGSLRSFRRGQSLGAARLVASVMKQLFPVEPELRYSKELRGAGPETTGT